MQRGYSLLEAAGVLRCSTVEALRFLRQHHARKEYGRYDASQVDRLSQLSPELLSAAVSKTCDLQPQQMPTQERLEL